MKIKQQATGLARAAILALAVGVSATVPSVAQSQSIGILEYFSSACVTEGCGSFSGPYGSPVTVEHFLPKCGGTVPAVIILHGSDGGTRYAEDYRQVGKGLAAEGYAAFIVYYYEGAPHLPHPGADDTSLPSPAAFRPWLDTLGMAITYVQRMPCVDSHRIGLLGMSLGGYLATSAGAVDPRVKVVVELAGGIPDPLLHRVGNMPPTLIVHGDADPDVPVTEAYKLQQALAAHGRAYDLVILPCEGHLPFRTYKAAVAKKVLSFLEMTL